ASNGARGCRTRALDPEQAEALAAFEAIRWAKDKGVTELHLEGDSERVVKALNGTKGIMNWINAGIIRDSIFILNTFSTWKCTFVHREANNVADTIAKKALSFSSSTQEWQHTLPSWLNTTIEADKSLLLPNS
ncbi:hypothetical protein MKW92_052576, partial [Papaver armeniacum]